MKTFLYVFIFATLIFGCKKSEVQPIADDNQSTVKDPIDPGVLTSDVVVVNDEIASIKIVIAGNEKDQYIVSFERTLGETLLEFKGTADELPVILEDNEGNKWDIFGYAVDGPRKGQRLKPTQSIMGFWFSFATFYPGIQIYPNVDRGEFNGKTISGGDGWLVPKNEVRSGGVGKDGIPAISNPDYDVAQTTKFLDNTDLVIGITNGQQTKAYPHNVLDWHEIINDSLNQQFYSIIYCPLTGTATAWDRTFNGKTTTFGVSGLLYNTNIVPYDRETNSNWSQLFDVSIFGKMAGTKPRKFMALETKWSTWKKMFPNSKVVNYNTGYNRSYGLYPYGNYKTEDYLIFPVKYLDKRLPEKERVHCIVVNGQARVYQFSNFRSL